MDIAVFGFALLVSIGLVSAAYIWRTPARALIRSRADR